MNRRFRETREAEPQWKKPMRPKAVPSSSLDLSVELRVTQRLSMSVQRQQESRFGCMGDGGQSLGQPVLAIDLLGWS